ncbi:MAG: hypothetical protein GY799_19970, partial [Desulfobulbaceae bacterium]|nr:hypothetical protein [Desulfobulbaceae bacterium]
TVASPQVLVPFDTTADVHLTTDASLFGLGAVLSIEIKGKLRPVSFASKIMTEAERKYSTPEQEALAAVWAMEKFNKYLFGQQFTLHSDQSSLQQLMKSYRSNAVTSRRIQRWLDRMQHYDYQVKYICGQDNVVADFLSRVGEEHDASTEPTLADDDDSVTIASILGTGSESSKDLLRESANDRNLNLVRKYLRSNWPKRKKLPNAELKRFHDCALELSEKDGLLYRADRLIIPESLRTEILSRLHDGHPGIVRMKQLYRDIYYWPRGSTEVEEFVNNCHACAESGKTSIQEKVPTGAVEPPQAPWQRICIDITGLFWTAPKHEEYIVIAMDYFSKWPEYLLT